MVLPTLPWRREVAVPRLIFCALERDVEADLHDLVTRPEHGFAHCAHPRMRGEVSESAERLRMRFHVPAARSAADRAAGTLNGLPEGGHHFVAQLVYPFAR